MVTKTQIGKMTMKKEKHTTSDISLSFKSSYPWEKEVRITVTKSGCVIVHKADEIFIRNDKLSTIEKDEEYTTINLK